MENYPYPSVSYEVADEIKDTLIKFSLMSEAQVKKARSAADKLSKKALWCNFIEYYKEAYDIALTKAAQRSAK